MQELRLFSSPRAATVTLVAFVAMLSVPFWIDDDFWILVLANAGIFAIGALGLNVLTGYTGQVSLGHGAFVVIGSYTAAYLGADQGWPLPLWLLASVLVAAFVGTVIGPFALRFRGNYLAVVTLALIFIVFHVQKNWESVTGGDDGKSVSDASLWFGIDFAEPVIFGVELSRTEGIFLLTWLLVGLATLLTKNLVRSRPGRAFQAIRDRDVAAAVVGVDVARYKVASFAISSGLAGLAGGLTAVQLRFLSPGKDASEMLLVSIRYIAIIVVGGVGTVAGSIIGAVLIGPLPELMEEFSELINFTVPIVDQPLLKETATSEGLLTQAVMSEILFGVLLVVFLMFQPHGVMGWWFKLRAVLRRRAAGRAEAAAASSSGDAAV